MHAARDIYYAKYYGKGGGNGQLGEKIKIRRIRGIKKKKGKAKKGGKALKMHFLGYKLKKISQTYLSKEGGGNDQNAQYISLRSGIGGKEIYEHTWSDIFNKEGRTDRMTL